jgi:hypothetical protein
MTPTVENLNECLDTLAAIMTSRADGDRLVPLYRRLERELEKLSSDQDVMTAALARARQSRGQRAAQSA